MASRLKSSRVREGAKALQPLALVALVGIVGTVTLLGGCGGGSSFNNNTTPPLIPVPSSGSTPTPTPTGTSPSPGTSPSASPSPTPSGGASPTPSPTPTPSMLTLTQALDALKAKAGTTISALALAPDNRWAVTYSVSGDATTTPVTPTTYGYYIPFDAPTSLRSALDSLVASSARVRSITLGAGDTWLITYNQTSDSYTDYVYNGIDANMLSQLVNLRLNQNINIKSAVIGTDPAVWSLIVNQNLNYSQGIPAGLATLLNGYAANSAITVDHIALGADSTYAVTFNNSQIAGNASGLVSAVNGQGFMINGIGLGQAGAYAVTYNQNQYLASGATRSR